jgi:hypothetical protein
MRDSIFLVALLFLVLGQLGIFSGVPPIAGLLLVFGIMPHGRVLKPSPPIEHIDEIRPQAISDIPLPSLEIEDRRGEVPSTPGEELYFLDRRF